MELRELLLKYKDITEDFIKALENQEYEFCGEELLNKREELLGELKSMSFDKDEFVKISKEIDLMNLEEKSFKLLNIEKSKIKEEIFNLKKNHNAVKSYGFNLKNFNFINEEV